jgi:hypothetical protein
MLSANETVLEVSFTTSAGKTINLKRAGVFPDLFVDHVGRVFQLSIPPLYNNNGTPSIRYHGHTIPMAHLVADAYFPGWDATGEHSIRPADGNWWNLKPTNIAFEGGRSRGRPRSSLLLKLFTAIEVVRITQDVQLAAMETGLRTPEVAKAVVEWAPWLVCEGLKGLPQGFMEQQIGNRRTLAMARRYAAHHQEDTPEDVDKFTGTN